MCLPVLCASRETAIPSSWSAGEGDREEEKKRMREGGRGRDEWRGKEEGESGGEERVGDAGQGK